MDMNTKLSASISFSHIRVYKNIEMHASSFWLTFFQAIKFCFHVKFEQIQLLPQK